MPPTAAPPSDDKRHRFTRFFRNLGPGLITGLGLAGVIRRRYPRWVLWGACSLLVVANVINIAADLGGMAEATTLVTGVAGAVWLPLYATMIVVLLVWSSYRTIAKIFKWLTLV